MATTREPSYQSAHNQLRLISLLTQHRRGLSQKALSERLDVSVRTLRRYITALEEVSGPYREIPDVIRELRDGRVWYRLDAPDLVSAKNLFQYAALYTAVRHVTAVEDQILAAGAEDVLAELATSLKPSDIRRVQRSFYYLPFGPKKYQAKDETVEDVVTAVVHRLGLDMVYRKPSGQEKHFVFEPWSIVVYRDGLYVYGLRLSDGERRTLALDRITEIQLQRGHKFKVPADFDPEAHFKGRFGLFDPPSKPIEHRFAFDADTEPWINERRWPGFVRTQHLPDGRLGLTLKLTPTHEITSWVLGWGPKVEVLAPQSLRDKIATALSAAAKHYLSATPPPQGQTPDNGAGQSHRGQDR